MSQCLTCRNAEKCTLSWKNPSKWMNCTGYIRSPETNADRIRAMSDEELAMWINDVTTNALSVLALGSNKQTKTIFYWLDWLKQEAE